jgi:glutamate synthase domain-containing protein 1
VNEQDRNIINPFGNDKDFAGCSIFGMMNLEGNRFGSKDPVRAISNMHDRSNGLGGGFAVYGIYPEYKDAYALHVMYLSPDAKEKTDRILASNFNILHDEEMQTRPANVIDPPLVWRYFVQPNKNRPEGQSDDECVLQTVCVLTLKLARLLCLAAARIWVSLKVLVFPKILLTTSASTNIKASVECSWQISN